jgi:hypothetical protein
VDLLDEEMRTLLAFERRRLKTRIMGYRYDFGNPSFQCNEIACFILRRPFACSSLDIVSLRMSSALFTPISSRRRRNSE